MNWQQKVCSATALGGYRTIDLSGIGSPTVVDVQQLISHAQTGYETTKTNPWLEVDRHLRALSPLGCQTLSLEAAPNWSRLVIGRSAPDGVLDLAEAERYFAGVERWLETFAKVLPDVKLSEADKQSANQLASGALGALAGADTASLAASILIELSEAGRNGHCITLHVVANLQPTFREEWRAKDLVSQPMNSLWNGNALWDLTTDEVVPSGSGFGEAPFTADCERLSQMLKAVVY